jgi:tagatose-1,6-bisphosphate aldolase
MEVDILKLQFPVDPKQESDETVWRAACDEVDAAATVPWTLLSAGVDYETFAAQARIASAAGASGVMVGRAVWAEAAELQGADRTDFLRTVARQRMAQLAQICADHAHPWFERIDAPDSALNWYERYGD